MSVDNSQKLVIRSLGRSPGDRLRVIGDVDVLGLPAASPELAAVALLDGTLTLDEVLARVQIPSSRLQRLLQKLQVLGLVEVNPDLATAEPAGATAPPPPGSAEAPDPPAAAPSPTPAGGVAQVRPPLTEEQEETIRREHGRIRFAAPHDVLGVDERASAKEIQRAYYVLVQRFHPDVFYGRDLGILESQLFEITQRHYEAYQKMRATAPATPHPAEPDAAAAPAGELAGEAQVQFEKGLAYFRRNDYVRARPHFELACAFAPDNATFREHLARVKKGLGIP